MEPQLLKAQIVCPECNWNYDATIQPPDERLIITLESGVLEDALNKHHFETAGQGGLFGYGYFEVFLEDGTGAVIEGHGNLWDYSREDRETRRERWRKEQWEGDIKAGRIIIEETEEGTVIRFKERE